jgi:anionic cell wall polymer biosynthesis LytR-Cps2A-Psr (LCP) family protein
MIKEKENKLLKWLLNAGKVIGAVGSLYVVFSIYQSGVEFRKNTIANQKEQKVNDSILINKVNILIVDFDKKSKSDEQFRVYQQRKDSLMINRINNPDLIREVREMTYWYKLSVENEKKNSELMGQYKIQP